MRILLQYLGFIVILAVAATLYFSFSSDMDKAAYNNVLIGCAVGLVVGVLLAIFGGKIADRIGGDEK